MKKYQDLDKLVNYDGELANCRERLKLNKHELQDLTGRLNESQAVRKDQKEMLKLEKVKSGQLDVMAKEYLKSSECWKGKFEEQKEKNE